MKKLSACFVFCLCLSLIAGVSYASEDDGVLIPVVKCSASNIKSGEGTGSITATVFVNLGDLEYKNTSPMFLIEIESGQNPPEHVPFLPETASFLKEGKASHISSSDTTVVEMTAPEFTIRIEMGDSVEGSLKFLNESEGNQVIDPLKCKSILF